MLLNIFAFNDLYGYLVENPKQTLIIRRHIVFLVWFIKRAWAACDDRYSVVDRKVNYSVISFVQSITKTSDASHAMVRIIPIIKIFVLEKLKLLKISFLKAEEKQAVVGVLNTDA